MLSRIAKAYRSDAGGPVSCGFFGNLCDTVCDDRASCPITKARWVILAVFVLLIGFETHPASAGDAHTLPPRSTPSRKAVIDPRGVVAEFWGYGWGSEAPRSDEDHCRTDSECASGLRCLDREIKAAGADECSTDADCNAVEVISGNRRFPLKWGRCHTFHPQVCTYFVANAARCIREFQLDDSPILTRQRCKDDSQCRSGFTCGAFFDQAEKERCTYLPVIVFPPGTKRRQYGDNVPPDVKVRADPLPKGFSTRWDMHAGPLPAAPNGYVWLWAGRADVDVCGRRRSTPTPKPGSELRRNFGAVYVLKPEYYDCIPRVQMELKEPKPGGFPMRPSK